MFNHLNFLLFELLFKMYNFLFTLNNRIKKKKMQYTWKRSRNATNDRLF